MRKYLQLTRAHTVPLEAVPALMGGALAAGTLWHPEVLLWGVFGVLYHLTGYGHNSVSDWLKGYDSNDPYKQHHPLNQGAMSIPRAKNVVKALLATTIIYAAILVYPSWKGFAGLVLALIFGLLYNLHGKETEFKFVFISLAHTMVFVVPYLALGGSLNSLPFKSATLFMFLWIVFQISVSGEVKDIIQDEKNFLINLGASVEVEECRNGDVWVTFSNLVIHYAQSIKLLGLTAAVVTAGFLDASIYVYPVLVILYIIQALDTMEMLTSGSWNRERRVYIMSRIEMLTAFTFVIMMQPIIGTVAVVTLCLGSALWVIVGNVALWGTVLAPKV